MTAAEAERNMVVAAVGLEEDMIVYSVIICAKYDDDDDDGDSDSESNPEGLGRIGGGWFSVSILNHRSCLPRLVSSLKHILSLSLSTLRLGTSWEIVGVCLIDYLAHMKTRR